jgi:hypothetical protein
MDDDFDKLMRESFQELTRNFSETLNRFIVFKNEDKVVEIPFGAGQRSKYINELINYFESLEEYEKCTVLKKLKDLVDYHGD